MAVLEMLALAGWMAAPSHAAVPHGFGTSPGPVRSAACAPAAPATLRLDPGRLRLTGDRDAPRWIVRFAVGAGASLAWDLADLPRRNARLPHPVKAFMPGIAFWSHGTREPATGPERGGAIAALLDRWNDLYPPYAIEGWDP